MTKEELDIQKEIEKHFTETTGFGRDKIKNFMDIVNKALKQKGERIAELEKENAELKEQLDAIDKAGEHVRQQITDAFRNKKPYWELEKENAEIDMKRKAERQIFQGIVEKKNEQLTKANLLLKDVYKIAMEDWNDPKWHDQVLQKAREYLKEIEK